MPIKKCSFCGIQKPHTAFFRRTQSKDGLTARCKDCLKPINKQNHRQYWKTKELNRKYNISYDGYCQLVIAQNNQCAICQKQKQLHIDHNHETNDVRGLLCGSCNRGLGMFDDDVDVLKRAIGYLQKTQKPEI